MRVLSGICMAVALLATADTLSAQTSVDAAALADSVARMDASALEAAVRAQPAENASVADQMLHALAAQRLFELRPAEESVRKAAERSFDRAKDRAPDLAWAHYGYGWALARSGELRIPVPGLRRIVALGSLAEVVGLDGTSRAQRALRRALELDPGLHPAALDLGRIALATRSKDDIAEAATAIQNALSISGGDAETYLVLSELQLQRGEIELAAEAARAAAGLKQGDPATARMLALTLLASGSTADRENGFSHYIAALRAAPDDSLVIATFGADILPIASEDEMEAWHALQPDARADWMQEFWETRAVDAVLPIGDRVAEHFRRVRLADERYRRQQDYGGRAPTAVQLRPVEGLPFDDRGMVYVRYGEPDTVVTSPSNMDDLPPPNETWVYYRPGASPLSFDFFKTQAYPDWVLAEQPRCYPFFFALGSPNVEADEPANLRGKTANIHEFGRWYEDRAFIDSRYALVSNACRQLVVDVENLATSRGVKDVPDLVELTKDNHRRQAEQILRKRQEVTIALRGEDARPRYDNPLTLLSTLYSFRGDGATDVTATVLIPSGEFTPSTSLGGAAVYPLRLSFMLRDSARGEVRQAHEVQRFGSPEQLPDGRYFRVMMHTTSPSFGRGEYRLRVENEGATEEGQVQVGRHAVRDFSGRALQLSDLVVAEATGGRWRRGDVEVSPIPTHQVESGATFRLFYEVYNLAEGQPYRTTLRIAPAEAEGTWERIRGLFGRGRTIELQFDEAARATNGRFGLQEVRSIGAELSPGRYEITVVVTNLESGESVERSAPLNVIQAQRR